MFACSDDRDKKFSTNEELGHKLLKIVGTKTFM